jgi:hypothetical protein
MEGTIVTHSNTFQFEKLVVLGGMPIRNRLLHFEPSCYCQFIAFHFWEVYYWPPLMLRVLMLQLNWKLLPAG